MYSLVLCHALRGNDEIADDWREFGVELAGEQTRQVDFQVGPVISFVETRLALHFGRVRSTFDPPGDPDVWWQARRPRAHRRGGAG